MMKPPDPTSLSCASLAQDRQGARSAEGYTVVIPANSLAISGALKDLRQALQSWGTSRELAARVELVAAEICNNIAEHGFTGRVPGDLCLHARATPPNLYLEISDNGTAVPPKYMANPSLPALNVACADLPEGGFGWFLIHSETDSFRFEHKQGRNHLFLGFSPRRA